MMRQVCLLGTVALLGATAILVPPSAADDPKPAAEAKQEAQAQDVELLAEAFRLAEFADKHNAPEAYVTAGALVLKLKAQTKGQIGELAVKPEVQDENDKPVKDAKVQTQKPDRLDDLAEGFFTAASALGLKQKVSREVEALIKAAKARPYAPEQVETRGAIGGPKLIVNVLPPKQKHVFNIPFDTYSSGSIGFQASAPARCKMQAGGHVHFNQVVRVGQYTWKPMGKEPIKTFTVTIHNTQKVPVTYKLFTN